MERTLRPCLVLICGANNVKEICVHSLSSFCPALCVSDEQQGPHRFASDAEDGWHRFETHLLLKNTRGGKRYKDWLFARAEHVEWHPWDAIQGGATLLLRDVVREYLRREHAPDRVTSLHRPVGMVGDSNVTLEELLPGAIDRCVGDGTS